MLPSRRPLLGLLAPLCPLLREQEAKCEAAEPPSSPRRCIRAMGPGPTMSHGYRPLQKPCLQRLLRPPAVPLQYRICQRVRQARR
jgi:hypothetical protein